MKAVIARVAPRATSKLNLAWDIFALQLALAVAGLVQPGQVRFTHMIGAGLTLTLAWAFGGFVLRFYDPWAKRVAIEEAAMLSLLVVGVTVLVNLIDAATNVWTPRTWPFVITLWPIVVAGRLFIFRKMEKREQPLDEVLVVGTGPLGRCTAEDLESRWHPRRAVIGHVAFSTDKLVPQVRGKRVLGSVKELAHILEQHPVSEIYFATNVSSNMQEMQGAIATCERYGMPFAVPATPFRLSRARPKNQNAVSDGFVHFVHVRSDPYQAALKRLFDIVASTLALIALMPLFAIVGAVIKVTSRGPLLFKQQRVGLHGRMFHMLKFRSMIVGADAMKDKLQAQNEQRGPVFKMKNDPRVTAVGRFIRKFSIDELPQLINVLRGDMSIVGPRPPVPKEVAQYEPWQRRRLSVRPGLTCIWQVSGRNQISFEDWMYMDMQYIDHWSLATDLALVLKTVPVVVTGRGAS